MEIKKKAKSFNAYTVELSWGQLEAVRSALEKDHADPLSDELYQGLVWYMNGNLPTPGEDESSKDKEGEEGGEGDLLDAPPAEDSTVQPGGPDQDAPLGEPPGPEGEDGQEGPPPPAKGSSDDLLPAPPDEE